MTRAHHRRADDAAVYGILAGVVGVLAGAAVAGYERRVRQRAERLAAAISETLLNAIDATDEETGAHVRRVARYALIIADAADAGEAEQRAIERVALFHDIGKIDEALFDIVHEDTTLTPEQREAIASHPDRGAAVLGPLADFYPDLPAGVAAHHERWDGTGYPRGLRGTRIPFAARVVTIADTFDAITHRRRYSPARGLDVALDAIRAGRATQFDPALVDRVLASDTLARLEKAMHEAHEPRRPAGDRRSHAHRVPVPDVRFRWE